MSYIRNATYTAERERPKLLEPYVSRMIQYLKLKHPDASPETIDEFVKKTVRARATNPTIKGVYHKSEGNSEVITMSLTSFVKKIIADNNLSTSGSVYKPVSKQVSYLRTSLESKVEERNELKGKYFDFLAQGRKVEAQYYNHGQANAKIFNNGVAGGMNITQFILGSKAGFNAITSIGRLCVKQGYGFVERFVCANIYLPSTRFAMSYILNQASHMHPDFPKALDDFNLYSPTVEDVVNYIVKNLSNYVSHPQTDKIKTLIQGLNRYQRAYVFYVGNFRYLCEYNDEKMRTWIDRCFVHGDIDPSVVNDIDLGDIKKYGGDVHTCILSTNYWRLGKNPEKPDQWNSIKDAKVHNPHGLKELIYCCDHFTKHFETMVPLLKTIFEIQVTFTKMVFQHRMGRQCVPLSDTDSNIFVNQELVQWKRKKLDFSQESYEMNAISTFLITQSLEHVFAKLSAGFGVEGKDVFKISMKNEFLYPILVVTSLAKHYLAIASMQEGSLLASPRKDIKGVGFRSSAYPKVIRKSFDAFVVDLYHRVQKEVTIPAGDILGHVARLEKEIHDSIMNYEPTFLQTVSVRREEDYADPSKSQYFYYEFWTKVFAPDYGEMIIPNKCYKIPLKGEDKLFKSPEFLKKLDDHHPKIAERLKDFMDANPKKKISHLLIPPFKGNTDSFFLDIMDVRANIHQVMTSYYHLLDSLGIGSVDKRYNGLVSDFYEPSTTAF